MKTERNRQSRRCRMAHTDQEFGEVYNGCQSCYDLPRTALMMKEYIKKKKGDRRNSIYQKDPACEHSKKVFIDQVLKHQKWTLYKTAKLKKNKSP